MNYNFCTLFDKSYLTRGLALHQSLMEQCQNFTLWILCMDEESFCLMGRLNLPNVHVLKLSEVEDDSLRAVKPNRTPVEYCWMFSSSLPLYLLRRYPGINMMTYLDADLYFYAPLDEIYQEFGENSIMIIPHGFSEKNKFREKTSGIYNVGMMIFRNDSNALECLHWWKERCIEWCFSTYEDGKLGDQLYLNDWPTRFQGVYVLKNQGANIASWNIDRFQFTNDHHGIVGRERISKKDSRLVFYHFHGLKFYQGSRLKIRSYPVTVYNVLVYKTYMKAMQRAYDVVRPFEPTWSFGCVKGLDFFRYIKQTIVLWSHALYDVI